MTWKEYDEVGTVAPDDSIVVTNDGSIILSDIPLHARKNRFERSKTGDLSIVYLTGPHIFEKVKMSTALPFYEKILKHFKPYEFIPFTPTLIEFGEKHDANRIATASRCTWLWARGYMEKWAAGEWSGFYSDKERRWRQNLNRNQHRGGGQYFGVHYRPVRGLDGEELAGLDDQR